MLFSGKAILIKEQEWYYLTNSGGGHKGGLYLSQEYLSKSECNGTTEIQTHFLWCCSLTRELLQHRDSTLLFIYLYSFWSFINMKITSTHICLRIQMLSLPLYRYLNFHILSMVLVVGFFYGMSTCLGLFYAKRLGNNIHCMFAFTFLSNCFIVCYAHCYMQDQTFICQGPKLY